MARGAGGVGKPGLIHGPFCAESARGSSSGGYAKAPQSSKIQARAPDKETNVKTPRKFLAVLLALFPLAAAAGTPDVTASKPWFRYLLPSIPAGAYMVLNNTGTADAVLTAAASPDCGSLMLHESMDNSGMAMMMSVPTITIPAGGHVALAPGGYHLMCMQPKMQVGTRVPVTLTFQDGASLLLTLPVYGATGSP
jgi:copper(I)-binding protein